MLDDEDDYRHHWETVWAERHELLIDTFGETHPPGMVTAFYWKNPDCMTPGGCAMTFPPRGRRDAWLTISHGLTQPDDPREPPSATSGYGCEFGFLTRDDQDWTKPALKQLLTYVRQSKAFIGEGHRVPMWFSQGTDGSIAATLGMRDAGEPAAALGAIRALLFWPLLPLQKLAISSGTFSILIATAITEAEWQLAKSTSSTHLLLLLTDAGIRQTSDLERATVTDDERWLTRWEEIRATHEDLVALQLLGEFYVRDS